MTIDVLVMGGGAAGQLAAAYLGKPELEGGGG
jgi:predicted flavoprotein YhiN